MSDMSGKYLVGRRHDGDTAHIISNETLKVLPFKPEAISAWSSETDLSKFLIELFNQPSVITAPDGSIHNSNYSHYGSYLFDEGITAMTRLAKEFSEGSLHVHHQNREKIEKREHDFLKDPNFGRAAKALVGWRGIDSAILSESAFVSIYHILEAGSDLDCSVELAKMYYYKQACYCLRAFVENVTLPLYFSQNPGDFAEWKRDKFRAPQFRGKRGLLDQLVRQGLLTKKLRDIVADVYERLNAYVHSSVERMIHKGHDAGDWRGLSFKLDELEVWSSSLVACVETGIQIMKIQTDVWEKAVGDDPDMCTICHSHDHYTVKSKRFGSVPILEFTCKQCGHRWTKIVRN
jgi:hypothetical protein